MSHEKKPVHESVVDDAERQLAAAGIERLLMVSRPKRSSCWRGWTRDCRREIWPDRSAWRPAIRRCTRA